MIYKAYPNAASNYRYFSSKIFCSGYKEQNILVLGGRGTCLRRSSASGIASQPFFLSERIKTLLPHNTEQNLAELNEHIENSKRDLEQLSFVISHDLQEPLRMIASYVQLLRKKHKGNLSPEADEYIDYAVDGVRKIKLMLNDLLNYLRIDSDREEIQAVSCNEIVKEVAESIKSSSGHAGTGIEYGTLPQVECKPTQIRMLFRNIIMSAIQFSSGVNPEIKISCTESSGRLRFKVQNKGTVIDPHAKDKIFRLFQKLHPGDSAASTGAELAICRKIVERHGGRIYYEQGEGPGCSFNFELPVKN